MGRNLWPTLSRMCVLLAAVPFLLTGCTMQEFPQTMFDPRSDFAGWVLNLNNQLILWSVIIFVIVQALLIVAMVKFRNRPGAPEPKHVHGNTVFEVAWTIAPAVILAIVAVPTVLTIYKTQGTPAKTDLHVKTIGHQWWWEFQYPDLGIVTANELHVPRGKTVVVDIEALDVIHSFWFPAIGGKRDAVPNHPNRIWFTPDSTGEYMGQCAEFCGISHANMRMRLHVDTPEQFEAWVAAQKQPAADPGAADSVAAVAAAASGGAIPATPAQGKQVFVNSACIGCHSINGVPEAIGIIGPNLTHFASRGTFAGSIFPNDAEHLGRWLTDPPAMKPGSLMPSLGLTPDQVAALSAYLRSLK